jgi:hypothetical protein
VAGDREVAGALVLGVETRESAALNDPAIRRDTTPAPAVRQREFKVMSVF